jgi:hypothetical protein
MVRPALWPKEELNMRICRRFLKYKLVSEDTLVKLRRDKQFLIKYEKGLLDSTRKWNLSKAIYVKELTPRVEHVISELNMLRAALNEVKNMV